jgi:hypothetical protein
MKGDGMGRHREDLCILSFRISVACGWDKPQEVIEFRAWEPLDDREALLV